jgi:hypothetical protein
MNETLSRLGFTLQQDFQSWLSHVADLDFHTALVDQSIEFDRLAQELIACEQISDSFFELEAWLISGFLPNESEAVVVSPEELFTPSRIDRPSLKREERDRHQKPLSATVKRVTSDRNPIPEAISKKTQPTGQSDFTSVSQKQPSIIPPGIEAAIPDQVEDAATVEITEPAKTIFPTSQNPVKGLKDLAAFLQEERSTQTDFSSADYLESDRDQLTWPLSSNSATNLDWQALKEDKAIVAAGDGPLNTPILGDFELGEKVAPSGYRLRNSESGETARLPQDWGLGGEWPLSSNSVTDLDWQALKEDKAIVATGDGPLNTPMLGDFELGEMVGPLDYRPREFELSETARLPQDWGLGGEWPLSSNSVTDLDWQALKEDRAIVATIAGPLNPPILGDFELGKMAGPLNSPILEDFETTMARKSPRIGGLGGAILENFATSLARKSPRIGGLGGNSAGYIDLDTLLEALQQEINQDYYRFYGS